MKILRPYQQECTEAILFDWSTGLKRLAISLATSAGKTVIMSEIVRRHRETNPNDRIVFLVHRQEILASAAATIAAQNPSLSVRIVDGTVTGAARDSALKADVVCINTATLGVSKKNRAENGRRAVSADKIHAQLKGVGLVLFDECHHAVADTSMDILTQLGVFDDNGPLLLGVSATVFREDNKDLNTIFQGQSYTKGALELMEQGYIIEPRYMVALVDGLNLNNVGKARTADGVMDFVPNQLDKVMEDAGSYGVVAKFVAIHASDRKSLVFTPTVHAAERVSEELNNNGVKSEVLSGSTSTAKRKQIIEDLQTGDLMAVCNVAVLSEGTDLPVVSCIVMARPTHSKALYRQIVGRSLRLHPDKHDAIVIDLVGTTTKHNLASLSDLDDDMDEVKDGETLRQAKERAEKRRNYEMTYIQEEYDVVKELEPELAEEMGQQVVSGSFNLIETDPYSDAVLRIKAFKEDKEKQARADAKKLPSFPSPEKCGPLLRIEENTYALSTFWYTKLPSYKASYVAVTLTTKGWAVWYCDSSKKFDSGRYGFVNNVYETYDQAEDAAVTYAKDFNRGSLYFETGGKINPHAPSRKQPATSPQISYLRKTSVVDDSFDEVDNGLMKKPSRGTVEDYLDLVKIRGDVRKQANSVREYYGS